MITRVVSKSSSLVGRLSQNASSFKFFSTSSGRRANAVISSDYLVTNAAAPTLECPTGNFANFLMEKSHQRTANTAVTCPRTQESVTYGALCDHMSRWGNFLDRRNIPKGAVVVTVAPNLLHSFSVLYGTVRAGRVWTGVNPAYTAGEIAHQLKDCSASLVVSYGPLVDTVKQAMVAIGLKCEVLTIGPKREGAVAVEDVLLDAGVGFSDPAELEGSETMTLLYSSGTTGLPKGAEVTHNNFISGISALCHESCFYAGFATGDYQARFLCTLPLFHIAGCLAIAGTGFRGGHKLFVMDSFDPKTYVQTIINSEISTLHLVPSMLNFALKHPLFTKENLPHLKNIFVGASPVPASAAETIYEKFGDDMILQQVYGMTETLCSVMDPVCGPVRHGYTGSPMPGVVMKVLREGTDEALPPYEDGEICVKSSSIMRGYLNNPSATAATIDADGYVRSGDVGHYDEAGRVCVVDRSKDLIKVNALQVSPSELENVLLKLPGVVEVAVVGVPHDVTGEAAKAFIVAEGLAAEEVHAWMASRCSKHKQLTGGVVFVAAIPKNATGKILRRKLREM